MSKIVLVQRLGYGADTWLSIVLNLIALSFFEFRWRIFDIASLFCLSYFGSLMGSIPVALVFPKPMSFFPLSLFVFFPLLSPTSLGSGLLYFV